MTQQTLYHELKQLTALGYLEPAQLERIQNEYLKDRRGTSKAFLVFALIGVIFIGAGILSLFAFNWSMLPRELKAVIAFVPLLGVQALLFQKLRSGASDTWIKSLTLALGIAFLCTLGLIFQAYHLSYSLFSILTAGFLLMLPVIYLLDGYYLAFLYLAGICWLGTIWNEHGGLSSLLVLLLLPYYRNRLRRGESCWQLSLCFFFWFLYIATRYVPDATFLVWVLVLLLYITIEDPPLYRRLARWLLFGLLFAKALFYHVFFDVTRLFTEISSTQWQARMGIQGFILLALAVIVAVRLFLTCMRQDKTAALEKLSACAVGIILTADLCFSRISSGSIYEILVNISLVAFSLSRLLTGVKQKNLSSVRRYTAAIVLYIVLKICSGDYPLLAKGVFFLIAGTAFLTINYMMTAKRKGGEQDDSTSK